MKDKNKLTLFSKYKDYLPLLLLLVIYSFFQFRYINLDFWNDEIYTLNNFVLTSFGTIVTDYHVPNNHILLSLITSLYVKITGLNDLFVLMESPYQLRLLPFIFSFITLFFTYKLGKEFFNKSIAIISVTVLITSIPFLNFAVQIRGYGLSTMLLVLSLYFYYFYLKHKKIKTLFFLSLCIAFLFYTIPSNLYFILGFLAFQCCYLLIHFITRKKENSEYNISLKQNIYLIAAIISGLLFSLVLYAPVFNEVFSNSYVDNEAKWDISRLTYYFPNIINAFTTNRWVIVGLFIVGIAINFKEVKKWKYPLLFIFTVFLIPFILTFFHRDNAPDRVFEFLIPLFCLMVAFGLYLLWDKLMKTHKYDMLFYIAILVYSITMFVFENKKISEKQLTYIHTGEKCQDLSEQYYLKRYFPLKDLKDFKERCYFNFCNVVLLNSEPHDIKYYLEKLNINYFESQYLDSLLLAKDSLYVVTNFPDQNKEYADYKITYINQTPAYYSILLIKRNDELYKRFSPTAQKIGLKYKDSVSYVFNISNAYMVDGLTKIRNSYFVDKKYKKKIGELINHVRLKPYICYVQSKNFDIPSVETIHSIINDEHKQLITSENNEIFSYQLLKTGNEQNTTPLFYNDYEKEYPHWLASSQYVSNISYKGNRCEKLDNRVEYSSTLIIPYKELSKKDDACFKVSFYSRFKQNEGGVVVLEVNRNKSNVVWIGELMNDYFTGKNEWEKVIVTFKPDKKLLPDDEIKIYIWNQKKYNLWIDNLKVEML